MANGMYRTAAGSTVEISGEHGGIATVDFDWFEEPEACYDCVVEAYPQEWGGEEWRLVWHCENECCGGGSAALFPVTAKEMILP